jgi:hypothetical protein
MKYMVLIASDGETWANIDAAEREQIYARILAWWEERSVAGQILEGHQLQPVDTATTVRIDRDGAATVTDGPFVEAKEMVGGYAIIDVPDLDAAIGLARTWPAPDLLEIRPLVVRAGMGA